MKGRSGGCPGDDEVQLIMKRDVGAAMLTAAAILIFGHAILLEGASPFRGDIPLQFYPWKCYARDMLASGEIPYWNPYTHGGAPFLANIQSAVFYPLDWLLFLFPMEWFYGLSLLLHLLLGGLGACGLARLCGASAFPSAVAGIAYGLNGFAMIHIPAGNHLTYAGAAWAPWLMMAAGGFITASRSRLPWALAGAGIVFLHFICGHPQMTFYSLVFSCLFALSLGVWRERLSNQPNYWTPALRTGVWSMFLVFGVILAAFQFIPTLQYFGEANRASGLGLEAATEFSFAPHRLITLLCPDYFGTMIRGTHYDSFVYWSCAYAGVWIPLLALIALWKTSRRNAFVIPLAITAFFGLLLAWGRGNPFYALMYQLPGFGHFRAPAKYLPYYLAAVCVLASLGIEHLGNRAYDKLQKNEQRNSEQPPRRTWRWATAALAGIMMVLVYFGSPFLGGLSNDSAARILQNLYGMASSAESTGLERIIWMERAASVIRCLLLLGAGAVCFGLCRLTPRAPRMALSVTMGLVVFLDVYSFGQPYLQASLMSLENIRASAAPPRAIGAIRPPRLSPQPERIMNLKDFDIPNVLMHWRLYNIAGYDPMSLRAYNRQIGLMEGWKDSDYHDNIQLTRINHPVLDRLNVRYVLTKQELQDKSLELRSAGGGIRVYERLSDKRAWAMTRPAGAEGGEWRPADSDVEFRTYAPHEILFGWRPGAAALMRVSEWHYPGWRAQARLGDDALQEIEIEPSAEGFRQFTIPENTVEVRMYYQAPRAGWALSGFAAILFAMLASFAVFARTDRFLSIMQKLMGRNF
ncbi:MAG: hypothetical protein JXR73_06780 [Candidatus Omnitrophica bacterium]|nr:hypothetical protein [Candidatus Omnitrophota bacterium]